MEIYTMFLGLEDKICYKMSFFPNYLYTQSNQPIGS